MKNSILKQALLLLFLVFQYSNYGQLVTGSCVHGGGIRFLLDAYLASIGACRCEREGVILTSFKKCETGPFQLVFEDNFDGDSLDISKWELPGDMQGAIEGAQNQGVFTLENVSLTDGICHLTGKKETVTKRVTSWREDDEIVQDGMPNLRTFDFTSGMIRTKEKFFYGKYEIRCKMPAGNGFWPAFWTFGGKRWNEIDFFDNYAGANEFVTSFGHDFEGTGKPNGCNATRKGFDLTQWHTFTAIFEYDKMTILIDGETVREINRVISLNRKPINCGDEIDQGTYYQLKAYPMEPMNIILNLSLISQNGPGGSVPVDETTPFPSSFDVDYVRYWKRTPSVLNQYPNPTEGKIKISSNADIKTLEVHNIAGQTVYKSNVYDTELELDLSTQPDGVFILIAELEGVFKTLKIVKIKP